MTPPGQPALAVPGPSGDNPGVADTPPPKMSAGAPKRPLTRLAPWIGALIVAMGATQAGLSLVKDGDVDMRVLGTGLLITGGGAGLIARHAKGLRLLAFVGGAIGLAALGVRAATGG